MGADFEFDIYLGLNPNVEPVRARLRPGQNFCRWRNSKSVYRCFCRGRFRFWYWFRHKPKARACPGPVMLADGRWPNVILWLIWLKNGFQAWRPDRRSFGFGLGPRLGQPGLLVALIYLKLVFRKHSGVYIYSISHTHFFIGISACIYALSSSAIVHSMTQFFLTRTWLSA